MVEVEIGKPHVIEQTLTYPADFINKIIWGDCKKIMKYIPSGEIDLTVTSPPYDDLRNYNGFRFDYEEIGREIFRITKKGGVLVWVVGDRIVKGDRTLTSFRQALCFQEIGFNVHDIMIYEKKNTPFMRSNAYTNCYEFMFIFSKGSPKTFNPILVPTKRNGIEKLVTNRKADGVIKKVYGKLNEQK
jgi:site-specific DNA-methyltransferase (adenine-specific)